MSHLSLVFKREEEQLEACSAKQFVSGVNTTLPSDFLIVSWLNLAVLCLQIVTLVH